MLSPEFVGYRSIFSRLRSLPRRAGPSRIAMGIALLAGCHLLPGCGGDDTTNSNTAGASFADGETATDDMVSGEGTQGDGTTEAENEVEADSSDEASASVAETNVAADESNQSELGPPNTDSADEAQHAEETTETDEGTAVLDTESDGGDSEQQPPAMGSLPPGGSDAGLLDAGSHVESSDYAGGPCPSAPPVVDSECEPQGAFCTYGDSAFSECREAYMCHLATGFWMNAPVNAPGGGLCDDPEEAILECQADLERGDACDDTAGNWCATEDEFCRCLTPSACSPDGFCDEEPRSPSWTCNMRRAGCPLQPRNAGAACDAEMLPVCHYGTECGGVDVRCVDGYYKWDVGGCP